MSIWGTIGGLAGGLIGGPVGLAVGGLAGQLGGGGSGGAGMGGLTAAQIRRGQTHVWGGQQGALRQGPKWRARMGMPPLAPTAIGPSPALATMAPGGPIAGSPLLGPVPMPSGRFAPLDPVQGMMPTAARAGQAVGRGLLGLLSRGWKRSALAPQSPGGYEVGVIGDDVVAGPGMPLLAHKEDMREQTIAPDLWCRRVAPGIAVPAGAIKRGYQVPLVDLDGEIEGWVRADSAIPANCLIVYGHADSQVSTSLFAGTGNHRIGGSVTVSDFEGSDYLGVGTIVQKPKRRRGGIHVTSKQMSAAKGVARKLKKLAGAHKEIQRLLPPRPVRRK